MAYDVTDEKTYNNIEEGVVSIYENTQTCQVIQKVLLANKIDLPADQHEVSRDKGLSLASKYGIQFFEVSAKDGVGVAEAFQHLAALCYQCQKVAEPEATGSGGDDVVRLDAIPVTEKQDRSCCGGIAKGGGKEKFSS